MLVVVFFPLLQNLSQPHLNDEGGVGRHGGGATLSVGQLPGDVEAPAVAYVHILEGGGFASGGVERGGGHVAHAFRHDGGIRIVEYIGWIDRIA